MQKKVNKRWGVVATLTAVGLIAQSVGMTYASEASNAQDTTRATGYISLGTLTPDVLYDENAPRAYSADASTSGYYLSPYLPSVKDQGIYGTCWAVSTISCVEANLKSQGYTDEELSEMHLSYFAYNFVDDELKGLTGDNHSFTGSSILDMGGNFIFAANSLADWRGAADESLAPYNTSTANVIKSSGLSDSMAYQDAVHLENFYYISNESRDDIKKAIVNYGAVGVCYYAYGDYSSNQYYNSKTAGYYCNSAQQANHAVTIVGWDDNYSASNFPSKPAGNGAWIVQNSWGEEYGDGGYFYLSYYDKSIDTLLLAVEASTSDNYDHNYQYDGSMWYGYAGNDTTSVKGANVFTAGANADGAEELAAVSFEAGAVNASYDIQIYKNLTDMNNPESGELCASTSGYTTYEGQYTAQLDTPVVLSEGDTYSVVVTLTSNTNSAVYLVVDAAYYYSGWFRTSTSADANESFLYSNGSWMDYGKRNNTNIRIKAYTNDIDAIDVPEEEEIVPTGITLNTTVLNMTEGSTATLIATVTPESLADYNVYWYSSSSDVASVEGGVVTALKPGTTYIAAIAGDYHDICEVHVTAAETDDGSTDDGSTDDGSTGDNWGNNDWTNNDWNSGWDNNWGNNDWTNNDWTNNDWNSGWDNNWGNNDWTNNDWTNNDWNSGWDNNWGNNDWTNNDWTNNDWNSGWDNNWGNNDWTNNNWTNNNWTNNDWNNSWGNNFWY